MRLRNTLIIAIISIVIISCKNDAKTEQKQSDEGKLPETVSVLFNVTVPKDDTFHLLYTEDETLNFGDDKSVALIVKGSDQPQDIIFKMPVDVLPTNIRLDLGQNKDQAEMSVNSMKVTYFDKFFEHRENVVKSCFYYNDFQLSYDDKTGKVKAVIGQDGRHVPLMWSNEFLRDEFKKIAQGK